MGWETRGNGRYYYIKRRENGRVVSEYIGTGPVAEAMATLTEMNQQERDRAAHLWQAERQAEHETDQQLEQIGRLLGDLRTATLIVSNCHTHRRQWRRKRNGAT